MRKAFLNLALILAISSTSLFSCTKNDQNPTSHPDVPPGQDAGNENVPNFDYTIEDYDGQKADDASLDVVGTDENFFWEANNFTKKVEVIFSSDGAIVKADDADILYDINGAYVTIDMYTNAVKNVEVVVSGKSENGALKIYGQKKFKLTLNGLELISQKGPAINNQCGKRVFVHLAENTVNRLSDASTYTDDTYYLGGALPDDEDRKGCFFSEGHLIFSGTGVLVVNGNHKHGIATDGYLYTRPGVTVAVQDAAKNAIHVKGDEDDAIGIQIMGGLIYANSSATAGKALKTDLDVKVCGGKLLLSTSGGSEYDSDENDTSSPACIKADGNVSISGGELVLKSTGEGGKGINVDGTLSITGGTSTVVTTGGKYYYNSSLTSSPKGVKADGDITIDGGVLNISVTGKSDGSEGLESKSSITINDGQIYIYAYDDAMNATSDITINGGKTYCYAANNDGIDSNGTLHLNGGLVIANGTNAPEEGFDCDESRNFIVTGCLLIGTGGAAVTPSSASTQRVVIYNGISATKGQLLTILNSDNVPILTYELPRSMNGMSLFFSSADLVAGDYSVLRGGTLSESTENWNGWYNGGIWTGGSTIGSFTSSSIITIVGSSGGPGDGGNPGGGPGGGGNPGGPGGRW